MCVCVCTHVTANWNGEEGLSMRENVEPPKLLYKGLKNSSAFKSDYSYLGMGK